MTGTNTPLTPTVEEASGCSNRGDADERPNRGARLERGAFAWFVVPRLPGVAPWSRGRRPADPTASVPMHAGLFRKAVIGPVFTSAAMASIIVAALFYTVAMQRMPRMSAAPEASANGSVVVLGLNATTRATGAGTVIAVFGQHVRILTAKHVAVFGGLSVRLNAYTTVPAHVVTLVPGHDVAVIEAIVPPRVASQLHTARTATARDDEHVTIGGSDLDGRPDTETADVTQTGGVLPDGAANGRFELNCTLCHPGDSGAGVFDAEGNLIGVYVGFWTYENGARVSIAEFPDGALRQ